jgi:hypothetical protein
LSRSTATFEFVEDVALASVCAVVFAEKSPLSTGSTISKVLVGAGEVVGGVDEGFDDTDAG